ncbi:hypothetical protein V490_04065 [Pseudogymnoascus sp. VKM F-3557]|nr:hypothetical protein V490_04065 [Pseudogymnoascus sp. VKM F-3557]
MAGQDTPTTLSKDEQLELCKRKVWDAERELMSAAQKHHEVSTEIKEPKQPVKLSLHANALRLEGIRRRITEAVDYELKHAGFFGYDEMGAQTVLRDALKDQHAHVDNLVFAQEAAKRRNAGNNGGFVSDPEDDE